MLQSPYEERRLRDGRVIAYSEHGSPHGQPVVYCHGAPSSRVEADLIVNSKTASEMGLRVIVPDRPGIGRSSFQSSRQILDWPADVVELCDALGIDTFAILGSSGGAAYALACGVCLIDRVRMIGLVGGLGPLDAPGLSASLSGPLRMMFRLAKSAPAVLRGLYRLQLRSMRGNRAKVNERMAAWFAEPDRTLLQRAEVSEGFVACFEEACRQGQQGPVLDMALLARTWRFELSGIRVPVALWQGELDRNVPPTHGRYLASAIPGCRATFYPDEAHLSVPFNHQAEILAAISA